MQSCNGALPRRIPAKMAHIPKTAPLATMIRLFSRVFFRGFFRGVFFAFFLSWGSFRGFCLFAEFVSRFFRLRVCLFAGLLFAGLFPKRGFSGFRCRGFVVRGFCSQDLFRGFCVSRFSFAGVLFVLIDRASFYFFMPTGFQNATKDSKVVRSFLPSTQL